MTEKEFTSQIEPLLKRSDGTMPKWTVIKTEVFGTEGRNKTSSNLRVVGIWNVGEFWADTLEEMIEKVKNATKRLWDEE